MSNVRVEWVKTNDPDSNFIAVNMNAAQVITANTTIQANSAPAPSIANQSTGCFARVTVLDSASYISVGPNAVANATNSILVRPGSPMVFKAQAGNQVAALEAGVQVLGGKTSSYQNAVTTAPVVTAASAYTSGAAVGGLLTFAGAVLASSGTGLLQKVIVQCKSAQTASMDLLLFDSNPTSTTVTDKTAFSLNTADFSKLIGVVHITDWTTLGTPSVGLVSAMAMPVRANGSTTLFGVLVTRGTPTFTSTSDLSITLQVIED